VYSSSTGNVLFVWTVTHCDTSSPWPCHAEACVTYMKGKYEPNVNVLSRTVNFIWCYRMAIFPPIKIHCSASEAHTGRHTESTCVNWSSSSCHVLAYHLCSTVSIHRFIIESMAENFSIYLKQTKIGDMSDINCSALLHLTMCVWCIIAHLEQQEACKLLQLAS
jgi:hypothetical protein